MNAIAPRLLALALACLCALPGRAGERTLVLVTTFPLHQIARGVAAGRDGFDLELLLAPDAGCPHDHALTPGEMAALARADILVVNGLGMEDFLAAALERAGGGVDVFDTSKTAGDPLPAEGGEDGGDHGHAGSGVNPHLFASPLAQAEIAAGLAERFAAADPAGAAAYRANARRHAAAMRELAREMRDAAAKFPNRRVAAPRGAFDYFARDMGLEIAAHTREHDGDASAARLMALAEAIRAENAAALVAEPQSPSRAEEALARETSLPVVLFDSAATGPEDAPLDYFAAAMRGNLDALVRALGPE